MEVKVICFDTGNIFCAPYKLADLPLNFLQVNCLESYCVEKIMND